MYLLSEEQKRQSAYTNYCDREDSVFFKKNKKKTTTAFKRPEAMYMSKDYQLMYCKLPKVACTNWKRVLIYLNSGGNVTVKEILNATGGEVHGKYSTKYFNLFNAKNKGYSDDDIKYRLKNYFKFIFVRHPLDRLLSAYNSKFNTTKWFKKIYMRSYGPLIMQKFSSRNITGIPDNITFEEFLRYIAGAPRDKLNRHWAPYFELCTFCDPTWRYDFIGKYEAMTEEANYLLDKWKVRDIRFPPAYRSKADEIVRFREAFADIPVDVIDAVWRRYYPDFALFDYPKLPVFTN